MEGLEGRGTQVRVRGWGHAGLGGIFAVVLGVSAFTHTLFVFFLFVFFLFVKSVCGCVFSSFRSEVYLYGLEGGWERKRWMCGCGKLETRGFFGGGGSG